MIIMAKTALVTGCLGGIGQEVCKLLLKTHQVIGWDLADSLDNSPLDGLLNSYSKVDHRDSQAVSIECAEIEEEIDLVICLAGRALEDESEINSSGELPSPEIFLESTRSNLIGHYNVVHNLEKKLHTGSSVVLVGSINSIQGFGMPAYSSAKAGLSGMAVSLAQYLGKRGVTINVAALGTVTTEKSFQEWSHSSGRFTRRADETCLGRIQSPTEAAHSIVNLATNFPYMTGQTVVIDAGASIFRNDI